MPSLAKILAVRSLCLGSRHPAQCEGKEQNERKDSVEFHRSIIPKSPNRPHYKALTRERHYRLDDPLRGVPVAEWIRRPRHLCMGGRIIQQPRRLVDDPAGVCAHKF